MDDVRNPQAAASASPHLSLRGGHDTLSTAFVPMRLVLQPGGAMIDVDKPNVLVGRHTDCDVRLPLPDVSRRHCRLQFIDGNWQVIDLNSLNGVQVNGEAVVQAALQKGDRLKVGGFTFQVDLNAAPQPRSRSVESIVETLAGAVKRKAS